MGSTSPARTRIAPDRDATGVRFQFGTAVERFVFAVAGHAAGVTETTPRGSGSPTVREP